jgi:hypothetical protein
LAVASPAESKPGRDLNALSYRTPPKAPSARKREFPKLPNNGPRRRSYRYLQAFIDDGGKHRIYFRRVGHPKIPLPGPIGSPEFILAYTAAFNEPLVPPSSLPGGVIAKRGRDPNAVQPLVGVYLLLLKGQIAYVGESLNMPKRVAEHRSNCRPFDQVFYIATKANERVALERILIKAIIPPQNHRR